VELLDGLALHTPKKPVFDACMAHASTLLQPGKSEHERKVSTLLTLLTLRTLLLNLHSYYGTQNDEYFALLDSIRVVRDHKPH
jgi:hypothetical protein